MRLVQSWGTGSGTWNYQLEYGIANGIVRNMLLAANALNAVVSGASFTTADDLGSTDGGANVVLATRGPYGWLFGSPSHRLAGCKFEQCGTSAQFPRSLTFAELPPQLTGQGPPFSQWLFTPIEGDELDITDCAAQGSFAGIVSAGGSNNHDKLRWNGSNWIRVG